MIYIKTLDINSQTFDLNKNYEEGFLKGSAWNNLYSFFKYEPKDINNNNDLEKLIYIYQIYSFISLELTLFIGTHPNNKEANGKAKPQHIAVSFEEILNILWEI